MLDDKHSVAVLFTRSAKSDNEKPFAKEKISRVYSKFSNRANKKGIKVFFAFYKSYKNGILKKSWQYSRGKWKLVENQTVSVVYSRFAGSIYKKHSKSKIAEKEKYLMLKYSTLVNHPFLDEFCWDKKIITEIFPRYCPKTFVVNTKKGLNIALSEIKSEKVVIKPRYGTLGKNVIITEKNNIPKNIRKNTIVQEFVDTSKGIKRVIDSTHDMRIVMVNGKIDHAHIRIPKKGLLTANVALGGKKIFISNHRIPRKAKIIAKRVDKVLKKFHPRIYSIDFLFNCKGKPYIVECNSQPMIDKYAFGKYANIDFYDRVIDALKSGIKIRAKSRWNTNKLSW